MKTITQEQAIKLITEGEAQTHEQRMAVAHEQSPYIRHFYIFCQ